MKKYISVFSVFLVWLAYLLALNPILKALGLINWLRSLGHFASLTSIIIQEIPVIIILLLLNHFFWHQKLLFKGYNWKKALGMLILPLVMFLAGLVLAIGKHAPASYIFLGIGATLLIGFAEELSFRGLIFGILVKNSKDKIIVPLFISSILFGLMHLVNIRNQPLGNTIIQVLGVMAFGLFAAVVYMKTSNLIFAIVVHAMNDFMAIMASSGSLSSQQTNPLTILYEWFIFGTLAFALFYTGWTQREKFIADIQERSPQLTARKLPTLAQSSTFRRIFALVSMIYGILILPTMLLFSKISTSADSRAEIANKALPIYLLFLLGIALYIFLIVFFDFHLGNLCWLLLPYIGGPVFALIALVNGARPLTEKTNQSKTINNKTPN